MIFELTTWIIPLILCMVVHEVAHGYMALKLGDRTALEQGRLTLNPIAHIDIIGSLLLPLMLFIAQSPILFGWAKPVPVSVGRLSKPKRDMGLVAIAGPISNLLLAICFALVGKIVLSVLPDSFFIQWFAENIGHGIMLSLVIGIFNLLPILPLDGGRILLSLLPLKYAIRYQETEKYGFFILFGVLLLSQVSGISIIGWFIGTLYPFFLNIVSLFI